MAATVEIATAINWETVARAETHELRLAVLELAALRGEVSPVDMARDLGESVQLVAYHVRLLRDAGLLEETRTAPRRGAVQHFYRLTAAAIEA